MDKTTQTTSVAIDIAIIREALGHLHYADLKRFKDAKAALDRLEKKCLKKQ